MCEPEVGNSCQIVKHQCVWIYCHSHSSLHIYAFLFSWIQYGILHISFFENIPSFYLVITIFPLHFVYLIFPTLPILEPDWKYPKRLAWPVINVWELVAVFLSLAETLKGTWSVFGSKICWSALLCEKKN